MSDENRINGESTETASAFRLSELQSLSEHIQKTGESAEARLSARERDPSEYERERAERIARAKSLMDENTERARRDADARLARMEYGGEYRQRLAARENKKAEEQKARLAAEAEAEKMRTLKERAREIEEFRRREEEEARQRALGSEQLLSELELGAENNSAGEAEADSQTEPALPCETVIADETSAADSADSLSEEEPFDAAAPTLAEAPHVEEASPEAEPSAEKCEKTNTSASLEDIDGRIILNIEPSAQEREPAVKTTDDGRLVIGMTSLYLGGSISNSVNNNLQSAPITTLDASAPLSAGEPAAASAEDISYPDPEPYTPYELPADLPLDYQRDEELGYIAEEALILPTADGAVAPNSDSAEYDDEAVLRELENGESISVYAKSALPKTLNKYYKRKTALEKKIRKAEKEQSTATIERIAFLIIAKIGIQKEIIELTVDSVMACIYAKSRSAAEKQRKILEKCIEDYNGYCDEYERFTGKSLPKISETMADEVAAGRVTEPLPNIYYSYDDSAPVATYAENGEAGISEASDISLDASYPPEGELDGIIGTDALYADGEESLRRGRAHAERREAVKNAIERDILLIGLRSDYRLSEYEIQRDMLANSFGNDRERRERKIREYDKLLAAERGKLKRATKLEREDNVRYYMLLMDDGKIASKRRSRTDRLNALKMRLEVLLSEREELNERLIALYGGSSKKAVAGKINRKAASVRRKRAKSTYKKHKKLARMIERMRVPLDMKDKAFGLLNKKIECAAVIEENTYKLKRLKPKGAARRELIADIKRSRGVTRQASLDLKFLIKKMKKRERNYIEDRNWAILWVVILLLAALGVGAWLLFGDEIRAAVTDMYNGIFGK